MSMDNKTLVRRYFEELWGKKRNLAVIDELLSGDFVEYQGYAFGGEKAIRGRDEWKKFVNVYFSAFPDIECKIDDMIAEGDKVVCHWTTTGTHKGEFMGIAPTNRRIKVTGITIHRVVNGKIVEGRANWDVMGLFQQLGSLPVEFRKAA